MSREQTKFVCQQCEATFPKWLGRCAECGEWNTLVEETVVKPGKQMKSHGTGEILTSFPDVDLAEEAKLRFSTTFEELDRVLGGGLVPGAVVLIGGEPGIGKSTLLTQVATDLLIKNPTGKLNSQSGNDRWPILYVAGEESPRQISLRINRYLSREQQSSSKKSSKSSSKKIDQPLRSLVFVTSTDVDELVEVIRKEKPRLVIVDSIQSMSTADLTGASGSVGQLRECTERLAQTAKALHIPIFLVGHVTKDGVIAGPKVLEHIVDSVIEISGERSDQLRLIRALKNRFGATDEVGVFQHVGYGLVQVTNPSELFLEDQETDVPGSATVCVMEGTRPLLIEVQALVTNSQLAMPRRVGRGIELSRIQVLSAVLQKHARLPLGINDVFLSAAGGFRVTEPAVDLGLAVAIASSLKNKKIPQKTIFIGEVG
ncbi:MAG: DNA repair protein RadA, partial [Candidatus Paceibacterota bacterium]